MPECGMVSVTRRTGARGKDRRLAVEDKLQQAMERLLEQGHSFTQVSVEQLAAEADIARATFYLHFRDKGELVARLMSRVTEEVVSATRAASPQTRARSELRRMIKAVVDVYRRHYAVMAAIVETAAYDAQVEQLFRQMMDTLIGVNRRLLQQMKQAGQPRSPPLVADVVTWAFERSCHQLVRNRKPAQVNALVDALTHVVWNAMYVPQDGGDAD